MPAKLQMQYCRIRASRHDYHGERYFKFSHESDSVVQVVVHQGEVKKGRSHTFGVHLISKMTLFSNYMAQNYTEQCTKADYEKNFDKVVKMLR